MADPVVPDSGAVQAFWQDFCAAIRADPGSLDAVEAFADSAEVDLVWPRPTPGVAVGREPPGTVARWRR